MSDAISSVTRARKPKQKHPVPKPPVGHAVDLANRSPKQRVGHLCAAA